VPRSDDYVRSVSMHVDGLVHAAGSGVFAFSDTAEGPSKAA